MNRATATTLLLLLDLGICCDAVFAAQNGEIESPCKEEICHISSDNLWQLQEFISSNRLIILNEVEFSVDEYSDFVVIENVSNLTISGGESGSLIECSPQSTFGLHLKNSTNVTLTGFSIRNCGSVIPTNLILEFLPYWQYFYSGPPVPPAAITDVKTSILTETSRTIVLSGTIIENSPGLALTVIDFRTDNPTNPFFATDNVNPHLTLTECMISNSRGPSIMVNGSTSLLIERTLIANSTTGLESIFADIMLQNVDFVNCSYSSLERGNATVRESLTMNNSSLNIENLDLHIRNSRILFFGDRYKSAGLSADSSSKLLVERNCSVVFTLSSHLYLYSSSLQLNNSTMTFTENTVRYCIIYSTQESHIDVVNGSSLSFTNNSVADESVPVYGCMGNGNRQFVYIDGGLRIEPDSSLSVMNNIGISVFFISTTVYLFGPTKVANNSNAGNHVGALQIESTTVKFHGRLEVVGNRGTSGVITTVDSNLVFTGKANFSDNYAPNGGAMSLFSSVMQVSPNATVDFTRNRADWLGGAIYISKPKQRILCNEYVSCSIQVLPIRNFHRCRLFSLTFNQNRAGLAGNAIYGDLTSACMPRDSCDMCPLPDATDLFTYNGVNDSSDLSDFTSDPTRVCFCENGIPDCYTIMTNITVHPGEHFDLSLVIVGYSLGTVPGTLIARNGESDSEQSIFGTDFKHSQEIRGTTCQDVGLSIVSERDRETISLAVNVQSFLISIEEAQAVLEDKLGLNDNSTTFYEFPSEEFFHIPVFVEVSLLPCPVGFQRVRGKCVCHQILRNNNIDTCIFSNGTALILRPAPYWIGLPNDTNSSILIHPHCPIDYCQSEDINITAECPNAQCQYIPAIRSPLWQLS